MDDLHLAICDVDGVHFETGHRVTFPFYRRESKAAKHFNFGAQFGQDIEPAGRYMSFHGQHDNVDVPDLKLGRQTFKSPLVLYWDGYGDDGWKARLSRHFKGKKRRALTTALRRAGFDGIVTIDRNYGEPSEIVDLGGSA